MWEERKLFLEVSACHILIRLNDPFDHRSFAEAQLTLHSRADANGSNQAK